MTEHVERMNRSMPGLLSQNIAARVRRSGPGRVWTFAHFLDLGPRAAVQEALRTLAKEGVLRRLARGVYDVPATSPQLGVLTPAPGAIARALVCGYKLEVSGERAANALGLSPDVPAQPRYLTDGPSRRIRIGQLQIDIRHTPARHLKAAGTPAGLAYQAMRFLGRRQVDEKTLAKLREALPRAERKRLLAAAASGSEWIRRAAQRIAGEGE